MKRTLLIIFPVFFLSGNLLSQKSATVKQYNKVFTTYPFSDPDPVPSFSKIYPYFRFDGFTEKPAQKEWKVVELENDYIRVLILPEIGGKIWTAIEKSTGKPFIYYNHAIKFRDVAMRGPWTSGGIEANYGIIGHTPNCATPVNYTTRINEDSSASCIIGVLDLLTRTNWSIEINLPKDKAYFTTKSFWYNSTPLEQPYYHWMNAGLKAKGNLEFIYPGTHYLGHEGEYADWPVNKNNGKKISFYEENDFGGYKSYHVFGKYTDFFGGYWHDDDFGMVRYAPHDEKAGKKIWIWGLSRQGMIWEKLLTDTDGQYVELQSGRLFNQSAEKSTFTPFKHKSFAPYSADNWMEYWYPVMHTKGITEANEYGALNVKYEEGWLKILFCPVQEVHDSIVVTENGKIIYSKYLSLMPLKTFADSVRIKIDFQRINVILGSGKLVYHSAPDADTISRPLDTPKDFDWESVYGLYLQGKEFADQRMYARAEDKLRAALQKDPNFLPALTELAALLYRDIRYDEALTLARRALSIDTYDGAANYYYGLIQEQLGNMVDAKDGFDLAALSPEYRSAAYTALSRTYAKEKNWDKSLIYATKAIDFDRYNIAALELRAIAYRHKKDRTQALEVLNEIQLLDPLNHFARFENYLWNATAENKKQFSSLIRCEQPQETYLELAINYFNKGYIDEAEKVLQLSPQNTVAEYWLAYLQYLQGENYSQQLKKADSASPAFIFPFRSETARVLQWALKQSGNWKPQYWLALIYKDRNRLMESDTLFRQLKNIPDYAPFYAARAKFFWGSDKEQALTDLMKAVESDKEEWRYHKLLGEYYVQHNDSQKALAIVEKYYHTHRKNYIMGMLYAKVLLLNKKYSSCDQLLTRLNIIPFEGATGGRELYREAKLMQALQQLQNKKFTKALQFISEARSWPENLGVGKPYETDVDERLEDWLAYYCYRHMGDNSKAELLLEKIIRFDPKTENTVRDFIPANHLITAWALEKKAGKEQALKWLDQQTRSDPFNKILAWVKEVFENDKTDLPENEKDGSVRVIEQIRWMNNEK
jgi:tetratricopeptide (TPR) repeat protein